MKGNKYKQEMKDRTPENNGYRLRGAISELDERIGHRATCLEQGSSETNWKSGSLKKLE